MFDNNKDISFLKNKRERDNDYNNEIENIDRLVLNDDSNVHLHKGFDNSIQLKYASPNNFSSINNNNNNKNNNNLIEQESDLPNCNNNNNFIGLNESLNTLIHKNSLNFDSIDISKVPIDPITGFVSYNSFKDNNIYSIEDLVKSLSSPFQTLTKSKAIDEEKHHSPENIIRNSNNYQESNVLQLPDSCGPKIHNVLSKVNLKCTLDLRDITLKTLNCEYNPEKFAGLIMSIKEPKTTALIFASGKMLCTGARSEEDSRKASRIYAKIIMRIGYKVKFSEFKIENIMASVDVKFPISLEGISTAHQKFCCYEKDKFPGLIYKMGDPRMILLIFDSGKIVFTGSKTKHDIFCAFQKMFPLLINFKKK